MLPTDRRMYNKICVPSNAFFEYKIPNKTHIYVKLVHTEFDYNVYG